MSLFFSVYKLSFSKSRKKWGMRLRGSRRTSRKVDEIAGEMAGESSEGDSSSNCQLIQLACGHLPLASNYSILCNGNHDIKMNYVARNPRRAIVEKSQIKRSTLIVSEMAVGSSAADADGSNKFDTDSDYPEDGESVASGVLIPDTASAISLSDSVALSESSSRHGRQKPGVDRIALQVSAFACIEKQS
jgi:hypothetical protein